MKIYVKSIEIIASIQSDGKLTPIRFRIERNDGSRDVVYIDRVMDRKNERTSGDETILFVCEAEGKICEIKYNKITCRWMLFKV